MSLHVQCAGCLAFEILDCTCEPGEARTAHDPGCALGNLHAAVTCRARRGCCDADHDHAAACDSCPGGHGPCPASDTAGCGVHGDSEGPCPGGHCGIDVPGCTVCRKLIVTVTDGGAYLRHLSGG